MSEKETKPAAPAAGEPIRDARVLGLPKVLILGLQHMFAMFGATVLVPILVNAYGLPLNIQTTLFFAGFGTLFFHVCAKMKVPAFLGSSFAFLGGFEAVANLSAGKYADMAAAEKLQYACGGIVVAGLLYVVLAAIIKAEDIQVTDEELEAEYQKLAEQYSMELDMVKKYLPADQTREQLANQKAVAVVVENATATKPEKPADDGDDVGIFGVKTGDPAETAILLTIMGVALAVIVAMSMILIRRRRR